MQNTCDSAALCDLVLPLRRLAPILGISAQYASRLARQGVLRPRGATLADQVQAYCRHLAEHSAGDVAGLRREKLAAEVALRRQRHAAGEIELGRLSGRLVEREAAEYAMRALGAEVRAAMDTYADQVAPLVAPLGALSEVHAVLAEQCRSVLVQVSDALRKQSEALG